LAGKKEGVAEVPIWGIIRKACLKSPFGGREEMEVKAPHLRGWGVEYQEMEVSLEFKTKDKSKKTKVLKRCYF
jgi:hypothetical protein